MPRISKRDRDGIAAIRVKCAELITKTPNFPEATGDRKILRFLIGHDHNVDKAAEMFGKYLTWRMENNVNAIRHNIIYGGLDHPSKFPFADLVLSLMPSLVLAYDAPDKKGCPICVDQYDFEPSEVIEKIGLEVSSILNVYQLKYSIGIHFLS